MPTFETPEPITAAIDIAMGAVTITAGERTDTVVTVTPTDSSKEADVKAAEEVRVELVGAELQVKDAKQWQQPQYFFRRGGSVDVRVELPAGSNVRAAASWAAIRGEGRLGEVRVTSTYGDVRLDETGPLSLVPTWGEIFVEKVTGDAEVANGSGDVRIGRVDGAAEVKNDDGAIKIGEVTGDLKVTGIHGGITVDKAGADVEARTAYGRIKVGEVARGMVALTTSSGEIEIGIAAGTAAKLDVSTVSGRVRSSLDSADGPMETDETVEVLARTHDGDIVIRRA